MPANDLWTDITLKGQMSQLTTGCFWVTDKKSSIIYSGLLVSIQTISALFPERNLENIYHLTAWSAIPESPWGIQLTRQVTNEPSFTSITSIFFFPQQSWHPGRGQRGACARERSSFSFNERAWEAWDPWAGASVWTCNAAATTTTTYLFTVTQTEEQQEEMLIPGIKDDSIMLGDVDIWTVSGIESLKSDVLVGLILQGVCVCFMSKKHTCLFHWSKPKSKASNEPLSAIRSLISSRIC